MWILLWVVLSSIVLGATLWSLKILMDQKKAWENFSKNKAFSLNKGTFAGPAEMSGVIGAFQFAFFSAERERGDIKKRRMVTVMECAYAGRFVDGAAMGSKLMLPFLQSLQKLHPIPVDVQNWENDYYLFGRHDETVKAYLTPERIDTFLQILKTKNADVVVIFNAEEILVRMETIDPMKNADKLDKITKRLMGLLEKLTITPEEQAAYQALSAKPADTASTSTAEPPQS